MTATVPGGLRADETNRFEQQLAPVAPAPVGEWWRSSWREGWTYQHHINFSLAARVKVQQKTKVYWWQSLLSGAEVFVGELNLETSGDCLTETGVIQNRNGEVLLSRYYPKTDVRRSIFRKPVGDPTLVDNALNLLVNDNVRSGLIKGFMRGLSMFAASSMPDAGATSGTVMNIIGNWIGTKADEIVTEQFEKNGIKKLDNGGIEIDPSSPLLKLSDSSKDFADVANLAVQLNQAFNQRMFMIRASTKSGDELDTRQIYNEGKDLATMVDIKNSQGADKAVAWLKERMTGYQQPQNVVRGVFQRETFALSKQIFDSQERHPGDTWEVQADFFNSFLHPDLKGGFRGKVVLHYVTNAKVPSRDDPNVTFDARIIEVLYKGTIDGRVHQSTLEYQEPSGFRATLQESTEGVLFIDKADNYVRQADLTMDGESQSSLPEMKILEGFEAVGNARFKVAYTSKGEPVAP